MSIGRKVVAILGVWLGFAGVATADIRLPALFSDNMVLQRGVPVLVWGSGDAGEAVEVCIGGQTKRTASDSQGRWRVRLEPLQAGEPLEMVVKGKNTLRLANVAVGEVWVASGQSNMAFRVSASAEADAVLASAQQPGIRLFSVETSVSLRPETEANGRWRVSTPEAAGAFSAVAYGFARELHESLKVPVGIILAAAGGTSAEMWTDSQTLHSDADFRPVFEKWEQYLKDWPEREQFPDFETRLPNYFKQAVIAANRAKAAGTQPTGRAPVVSTRIVKVVPSGLYNAMIAPLMPYAVRGVVWYQGESNGASRLPYAKLFPAMIRGWRKGWGQELPFIFVQLPNFADNSGWPLVREGQLRALTLPDTAMAVAIDLGEAKNVHPKSKREIVRRLSLAALGKVYGQQVVWSGPAYTSVRAEGSTLRVSFESRAGGLRVRGGDVLKGFTIAGADRQFFAAQARIEGSEVVLWAGNVKEPCAARYAWSPDPVCNLTDKSDLPASPFRTDDWPVVPGGDAQH